MANGYTEKILEVNLSTGTINATDRHMAYVKSFIGGRALGGKLLWEFLKDKDPGLDPTSPDNPLMFLTGPFSGIPIPSASRITVYTKSGLTKALHSPYENASTIAWGCAGGMFAPELKMAGYDGIIFTGKAAKPVYLFMDNDKVEIRDASHLWGKTCNETDVQLREELGEQFRTMYIGPAGENGVYYSAIMTESTKAAGRSGQGRVMGSKNLKAIAVHGTGVVPVADSSKILQLRNDLFTTLKEWPSYEQYRRWGTANLISANSDKGIHITKNFHEGSYEHTELFNSVKCDNSFWVRHRSCFQCPLRCMKIGVVTDGPHKGLIADGPEYEGGTLFGANLLGQDFGAFMANNEHCDNYGLDTVSTGNVMGFAMECYEKGLITKKDLNGIDLKWGNQEAALKLQDMIVKREGIGDLLSKGVMRAAASIGNGAAEHAMHVKGQELAAWGIRANHGFVIIYGTSTRGACHQVGSTVQSQNERALCDTLVACRFVYYGLKIENLLKGFNTITGWNYSPEQFLQVGERSWNQEKVFNVREGFRREDDYVPKRFQEPLTQGPMAGAVLTTGEHEKMLDDYYTERGWDVKNSIPKEEKLKELGLDDLIPTVKKL